MLRTITVLILRENYPIFLFQRGDKQDALDVSEMEQNGCAIPQETKSEEGQEKEDDT